MLVYINYESGYLLLMEKYLVRCFGKKSRGQYLALRERGGGENRIVTNLTLYTLHHILLRRRNRSRYVWQSIQQAQCMNSKL